MNARERIAPGETAVVVFTHGPPFVRRGDGSGSTGNRKISLSRKFDQERRTQGQHDVQVA